MPSEGLIQTYVEVPAVDEPELSLQQQRAIEALLSARSYADAARHAGCNERSLRRWLRDDFFRDKYRQARREAAGRTFALMHSVMARGAKVLDEIVHDSAASPSARVSALRLAWEWGQRGYELEDIEDRLDYLDALSVRTRRDRAAEIAETRTNPDNSGQIRPQENIAAAREPAA